MGRNLLSEHLYANYIQKSDCKFPLAYGQMGAFMHVDLDKGLASG